MPASPAPTGILIGRDQTLLAIAQALDGASSGQGGVVMIGGEAGIGKTRLADHVAGIAAARGMRTAWGRAAGDSGAPVYWLWTQVFRSALRDRAPDATIDGLDAGVEPLRRLLPELDAGPGHPIGDAASTPDQARFRLFQSATDCLRRLTELPDHQPGRECDAIDDASATRGLLIVLDDIDQADDASLGLLTFAAHAIDATAIVILCTFREESVSQRPVLRETLAELARARAARRLTLGPLHACDVGALLEHLLGMPCPPALAAALHDHTGGNPFFLTEVVRALAGRPIDAGLAALPALVREVVRIRIERLTPDCGVALAAAAVLGREFDVPVLGRVSGLPIDALLEALEEAERAHIVAAVESEPGRFRFEHAIIRDTLYEALPAARRVRLHRAAGDAIEAHCAARLEPHAPSLAHHFFQAMPAGGAPRALRYAEQAAGHAASVYAYSEAARLYDIALRALAVEAPHDDARRFDLLVAAGRTFERAGLHDSGRERLLEAADLARRLDSPHRLAETALAFSRRVVIDPQIHSLVQEALRRVPATDRMLRLRLLTHGTGVLPFSPEYVATLNESVALAREMDDPASAAIGLEARYRAGWHFDSLAERLRAGAELLAAARAAGEHEIEFLALWGRAYDLLEAGDRCALDDTINALHAIAQHTQQARHLWIEAGIRAAMAILDGRFEDAERLAAVSLASGQHHDPVSAGGTHSAQLYLIRTAQGRSAEIEETVRAVMARMPANPNPVAALMDVLLDQGKADEAAALFDRFITRLEQNDFAGIPRNHRWLSPLFILGLVCARLGDRTRAALLFDLLQPYSGHHAVVGVAIGCHGAVDHVLGMLATVLRRWEAAESHFEVALAANERLGARVWVARTQLEYAIMLLEHGARGDLDEAADLTAQGDALAADLGMNGLVAQARAVRDRIDRARAIVSTLRGGRPALSTPAPDGLTPREVEVLALLAAGHTSKEMADLLVLSTFTVARHITKIYNKIGARGRADATAYAIAHGLTSTDR